MPVWEREQVGNSPPYPWMKFAMCRAKLDVCNADQAPRQETHTVSILTTEFIQKKCDIEKKQALMSLIGWGR